MAQQPDAHATKPIIKPFVDNITFHTKNVTIQGWSELQNINQKRILVLLKKRNSPLSYTIPITWINQKQWNCTIDFDHYPLIKGTWDYYFQVDDSKYRIKLDEHFQMPDKQLFYNTKNGSLKHQLYKTINGSLSSKIKTATITATGLQATIYEDWFVSLSGSFNDPVLPQRNNLRDTMIIFQQRNTDKVVKTPVTIKETKQKDEQYTFHFDLDYRKLVPNDLLKVQWNVFLEIVDDHVSHWFRIQTDGKDHLAYDSRITFEAPNIRQIYYNVTKYNHLSVYFNELHMSRDIEYYAITKNVLHLQGYAYLDTIHFDENNAMKRSLIVRNRDTDEMLSMSLNSVERKDFIINGYDYTLAGFDVKIALKDILPPNRSQKAIYDFYIQIQYNDEVKERKLGFEEFTYYKDDIVTQTTLKHKGTYYKGYFSLTPSGNLKLECFGFTLREYLYLRYGQNIDRKRNKKKDIWLIGERPDTAQDTGCRFFEYCRKQHPEKEIYYVIDPSSKDIKNIKGLGNIIYAGSLKHLRKASIASTFIGSHDLDYILPIKGIELGNYINGRRIFIQHGVLGRKNVEYHKSFYKYPFQLFCVSSNAEKNVVHKKLGYEKEEIKVTGLSRFDRLLKHHHEKRSILLIPTWREWLNTEENFIRSNYYKRYMSLLKNERLVNLLNKFDVQLNFYPHYRMQPLIHTFNSVTSERIHIVRLGEKNVQDLLLESKLMITDYSSVSFDFNYMSKPIIFYHFDSDTFFKNGILRPIEETFLGDICKDEEQIIDSIAYYLENNFKERDEITNKKHLVFSNIDDNNCKRIFKEIKNKGESAQ